MKSSAGVPVYPAVTTRARPAARPVMPRAMTTRSAVGGTSSWTSAEDPSSRAATTAPISLESVCSSLVAKAGARLR